MNTSTSSFTLNEAISDRRSPLAFSLKPIESSKIYLLFEAARWAPSSYNEQPWRFIYSTRENPEGFQKLHDCLMPGNQSWVKNVPMLVLSVAKKNFSLNDEPNFYAFHDVGLATQNLMLQAVHMGLVSHPMGGFDKTKARELFQIPDGYAPAAMIAIGYAGNPGDLAEDLYKRETAERIRKPQSETVFSGKWILA